MRYRKGMTGNRGFALLVVFILMSAVTIGLVMLVKHSFKGAGKNKITVERMNAVAAAYKKYYSGHHKLPPALTGKRVPVAELGLATEFGFDGWGKFIHCNFVASNIQGITVDGKKFAVVLVSGGPDQDIKSDTWPGSGTSYAGSGNDDIVLPVALRSEAIAIVISTLHSFASKTCSYICSASDESLLDSNDLDGSTVIADIVTQFSLNNKFYTLDPWGRSYQWLGDSVYSFRSLGPDGVISDDDIVVAALHKLDDCCSSASPVSTPKAHFTFEPDQITKKNGFKPFPFPFPSPFTGKAKYYISVKMQNSGEIKGVLYGNASPVKYGEHSSHSTDAPTEFAGKYCVYFDGKDDYILMNASSALSFSDSEQFTLMAWCKRDKKNGWGISWNKKSSVEMLVSGVNGDSESRFKGVSYFLSITEKGNKKNDRKGNKIYPFGGVWDGKSILYQSLSESVEMNNGSWYHFAVVFDNGSGNDSLLEFYKNGENVYEKNSLKSIDKKTFPEKISLLIAAGICEKKGKGVFGKKNTCDFFKGWIDEVYFYDKALNKEEIVKIMKGE